MSTVASPVQLEIPTLREQVRVVEPAPRWGAPIWPAEAPNNSPGTPDVVPPNWMMVAVAFGQRPM